MCTETQTPCSTWPHVLAKMTDPRDRDCLFHFVSHLAACESLVHPRFWGERVGRLCKQAGKHLFFGKDISFVWLLGRPSAVHREIQKSQTHCPKESLQQWLIIFPGRLLTCAAVSNDNKIFIKKTRSMVVGRVGCGCTVHRRSVCPSPYFWYQIQFV